MPQNDTHSTLPQPSRRDALLASFGIAGLVPAISHASTPDAGTDNLIPDPPRDLVPTGADIGSLFPQIQAMADRASFSLAFTSGRFASLDDYKIAGRAAVRSAFGRVPDRVDLRPEVVNREDLGDIVREKVLFSTTPELRVPAYLHIPKAARDKPHPAIVDLHSHGGMFLFGKEKVIDLGPGRNHPVMQAYHRENYGGRPTATELARRGYVVITIDALMFGERRLMRDKDFHHGWDRSKYSLETAKLLNDVCRSKEATLVKSLMLAGYTWPGLVTWDDQRTIDYLVTRPEVDPARIGCLGVSMGGHRTLYLAGMDERIAAACVVGFMSTVHPMIKAHIDTHSFVHFVPGLHQFLDMPDVVAMMAPKPLMVQQCRKDGLYPPVGMVESVAKIAAVYAQAGVAERFTSQFFDVDHRFDQTMQDAAFAFMDRWLKP
jgi:dienelactone hydrolase